MFYPPTCVGLRYGRRCPCLGVLLGTTGSRASLKRFVRSLSSTVPDLHGTGPTLHHGDVQNPAETTRSVAPSVVTVHLRCRNVHLLRVAYGFRPRLSPRLTLGG